MTLEQEMQETFALELQIAKLLFKSHPWQIPFKELRFTKNQSRTTKKGIIYLSTQFAPHHPDEYRALRTEIRHLLVNLHSGITKQENFIWQRSAKLLGLIKEIDAIDKAECTNCGILTPLTSSKLCVPCKRVYDAVKSDPAFARRILDQ